MWVKFAFFVAIICSTFAQVSAWSIDAASCDPPNRTQNLKDMLNYIMKWPEKVDKSLGNDKAVNTFAKNLFNEGDFGKVKTVINAVGAMSKEDTSGTDTMDPIIYCNQQRIKTIKDATDPSKTYLKDTTHDIILAKRTSYDGCLTSAGKTKAYTRQWISSDNKKHTYIQLCPRLLNNNGQIINFDGQNFDVQRMNVASEFMKRMRGAPAHIDNFFPILKTLFHEFVHTFKVQYPNIKDGDKTYGWAKCTSATEATALNNADSYAYLAMGTWLIKRFGAAISNDGTITDPDQDELGKRNEWVGLPWIA